MVFYLMQESENGSGETIEEDTEQETFIYKDKKSKGKVTVKVVKSKYNKYKKLLISTG